MKTIWTLLILFAVSNNISGQVITHDDFTSIIPLMQKEDYKEAFKKTKKLLEEKQNDSSDLRAIVTYMNRYAAAGMVTADQMSFKDFTKNANKYIGQRIVMSAHPCIDSSKHGFNSLQFRYEDGVLHGSTTTSNSKGFNILFFEYFYYANTIYPEELIGENVRCGGILESIEVNPNKSKIWIARLHVSKAFARKI